MANAGATVALADTAPTNDRYNIVAVEITSANGAATLQSIAVDQAASPGSAHHVVHYSYPAQASTDLTPLNKHAFYGPVA